MAVIAYLPQVQMTEGGGNALFDAKSIFSQEAVVNRKLTTAMDGKEYLTQLYALP
jgi:hypothetical protein